MTPSTQAWVSLGILSLLTAVFVFLPAGTLRYWQGWVFLGVFLGGSLLTTVYVVKNDPALLRRRLRGGPLAEKGKTQKIIMLFTAIGFTALLVVPGLDQRFGWSHVPPVQVMAGDVLIVLGFYIIFRVYKENSYASATIEVASDQRVISTGPYAVVRHPMYFGAILYLIGMPLALGSYRAILADVFIAPFLLWRIFDEERFLTRNLPGYAQYCAKVRWRLVPGVF